MGFSIPSTHKLVFPSPSTVGSIHSWCKTAAYENRAFPFWRQSWGETETESGTSAHVIFLKDKQTREKMDVRWVSLSLSLLSVFSSFLRKVGTLCDIIDNQYRWNTSFQIIGQVINSWTRCFCTYSIQQNKKLIWCPKEIISSNELISINSVSTR